MAVSASNIVKRFAGLKVLDGVDLGVGGGQFRALLGANGSGKSTLVKILTGVYQPDGGSINIRDRRLSAIASPNAARKLGMAVVHQETPLIDTLTVLESIGLFHGFPTRGGRIRWAHLRRDVEDLLGRYGIEIDPNRTISTLSAAERATLSLVIALDEVGDDLNLLVLDEVTASIPSDEATPFLDRVAKLAAGGMSILMVTHRLGELRGRASHVSVLRGGKAVFDGEIDSITDQEIVEVMTGRPFAAEASKTSESVLALPKRMSAPSDTPAALEVVGLTTDRLHDVSIEVYPGEVVGVAGLEGGGVADLVHVLGGVRSHKATRIAVGGRPLFRNFTPRDAIKAGLAVLPADRLRSGGIESMSVADNITLPDVDRYFLCPSREKAVVESVISELDVRPARADAQFGRLSGGNQQKVLLGKWLHLDPSILVLEDPTNGVDPGAREAIFAAIRQSVDQGLGVLMYSTEPEQLEAVCSRVLILKNGMVAAELAGDTLNSQQISMWCYS